MARANVDLPQPDSPTTPKVSPSYRRTLTPSTAFKVTGLVHGHADFGVMLKWTLRSLTSSNNFFSTLILSKPPNQKNTHVDDCYQTAARSELLAYSDPSRDGSVLDKDSRQANAAS
ncbi:Uncharacterised protein [Vibrio cholerae]|nr:Uncharacterised protein [Vibrio cholerae]CSI65298.1 Uncharacterised protein [Vibrio cholerae]